MPALGWGAVAWGIHGLELDRVMVVPVDKPVRQSILVEDAQAPQFACNFAEIDAAYSQILRSNRSPRTPAICTLNLS